MYLNMSHTYKRYSNDMNFIILTMELENNTCIPFRLCILNYIIWMLYTIFFICGLMLSKSTIIKDQWQLSLLLLWTDCALFPTQMKGKTAKWIPSCFSFNLLCALAIKYSSLEGFFVVSLHLFGIRTINVLFCVFAVVTQVRFAVTEEGVRYIRIAHCACGICMEDGIV